MVLAQRDDADCLEAALPSASKGKGKVELRSPLSVPCPESGGQEGGGKAWGLPCYLFSMLCICRLREVKLAKRSVTSSTCRRNPGGYRGSPWNTGSAPLRGIQMLAPSWCFSDWDGVWRLLTFVLGSAGSVLDQ